jgi:hypothetical protein
LMVVFCNWNHIGDIVFVLHHSLTISAYYLVVFYGGMVWFANFRLLAEFSTPFVNQRWFLDVLGLKASKASSRLRRTMLENDIIN